MDHSLDSGVGEPSAAEPPPPSDAELLGLFAVDPRRAWQLFLDRHAGTILGALRRLGFDYDEAMDRFLYVCEKLCERDFRRLRSIRYLGDWGDLTPWLLQVVRRLAVSWAWSRHGRRRLLRPITRLPRLHQRVFELHCWRGLLPSEIHQQLRAEGEAIELHQVLLALEEVLSRLGAAKRWRLLANLARRRRPESLEERRHEIPAAPEADPERSLLAREAETRLQRALASLPARTRLIVQLRYEEGLTIGEIGASLRFDEGGVRRALRQALAKLREQLR